MNRYDISNDYRKKFVEENKSVWSNTIKPVYFSINGNQAKASSNPYSMEQAEHGLVAFTYSYTVISQDSSSLVPLFFNANGDIEDYIIIDGWKLYFSEPITSMYRCYSTLVYMEKGTLKTEVSFNPSWKIVEEFPRIWELFCTVRTCNSQVEIDYVKKIYNQGIEIDDLKSKNLVSEAKIESLNILVDSYKQLLEKISNMLNRLDG
jgi:hypothetical protein